MSDASATLWLEDAGGDARPALRVRQGGGPPRVACVGLASALPFLDGAFDEVNLRSSSALLAGRRVERVLRECLRVLAPEGRWTVEVDGADRRRLHRALDRAGFEGGRIGEEGPPFHIEGRRESGVTRETWLQLERSSAAATWNDSMFEFQQTPYDPHTIAGRIFLSRVHRIARTVAAAGTGRRVLEVGCEAGGLLRHLPEHTRVVGVDLSLKALRAAQAALRGRGVTLVHADAMQPLPFADESFDFVLASEVLEHCRSPHRAVAQLHRVLRRDGRAIVSVPNERIYLRWKSFLRKLPLLRRALAGIEEGPAAWHVHHDFDRSRLVDLIDGFFAIESETSIWGTTLVMVLRKV